MYVTVVVRRSWHGERKVTGVALGSSQVLCSERKQWLDGIDSKACYELLPVT